MVVATKRATRPQAKGNGQRSENFDKVHEKMCPFCGGKAKHLLKGYGEKLRQGKSLPQQWQGLEDAT